MRATALLGLSCLFGMSAGCRSCISPKPPPTEPVVERHYGDIDRERQRIEVFRPEGIGTDERLPAVVFIHGGGWKEGTLNQYVRGAQLSAAKRYVGISINYRLVNRGTWPIQIQDVKCAIRYIKHNAVDLNVDPQKIALFGYSAGGQLALLAAFSQGVEFTQEDDAPAGTCAHGDPNGGPARDSSVVAVAALSAPADLWDGLHDGKDHIGSVGRRDIANMIGLPPGELFDEALRRASPIFYIGPNARFPNASPKLPVLLMHGTNDPVVSTRQPRLLLAKLEADGFPIAHYVPFCGGKHTWGPKDHDRQIEMALTLFAQAFNGTEPSPDTFAPRCDCPQEGCAMDRLGDCKPECADPANAP